MKETGSRIGFSSTGRRRGRGVLLFSGGLDSLLAARVATELGIDTLAVHIRHLFETERGKGERLAEAAGEVGVALRILDLSKEHLEVVRHPVHGYGSGVNPCLDCRVFMLRAAKRVMEEEGADVVMTGEVVGQRPMSQHLRAMALVAEESGLGERLFRPLSAGLLPDALPVRRGWVRREDLLTLRGRGRGGQAALADRLGLRSYPQPAGGCLLLEKVYAARVRDAFTCVGRDAMGLPEFCLLKVGRHFRLSGTVKVIVGRNAEENEALEAFRSSRVAVEPASVMGPLALVEGAPSREDVLIAASLTARYCDHGGHRLVQMRVVDGGRDETLTVVPLEETDPRIAAWRIEPRR